MSTNTVPSGAPTRALDQVAGNRGRSVYLPKTADGRGGVVVYVPLKPAASFTARSASLPPCSI